MYILHKEKQLIPPLSEETNKLLYQLKAPPSSTDDMEEDSLEIKLDLNIIYQNN